jgi:hypothetical protein
MIGTSAVTSIFSAHVGSIAMDWPFVLGAAPCRRSTANSPSNSLSCAPDRVESTLGGVQDFETFFAPTTVSASVATPRVSPPQASTRQGRWKPSSRAVFSESTISAPAARSSGTIAPTRMERVWSICCHDANVS